MEEKESVKLVVTNASTSESMLQLDGSVPWDFGTARIWLEVTAARPAKSEAGAARLL